MKKIFYILSVAALAMFAACSEEPEPTSNNVMLQVVRSDVGFTPAGGQGRIELNVSGPYKAESSSSWLTIDSTGESTITYSVAEYDGALGRSAQIIISADTKREEVTIIQQGSLFDVESGTIAIDPLGMEPYRIEYIANGANMPEVTVSEAARDWLHVNVTREAIEVLGDLNVSGARKATLTVTQDWKTVEVPVSQAVVPLVNTPNNTPSIALDADALETTLTVTEYMDMVSPAWEAVPSVSWIKAERNGNSVKVTVEQNLTFTERTGAINFRANGQTVYTVTVSQGKVGYSFYLGNWKFDSYDFDGILVTTNITIAQKVAGKTYTINGLLFSGLEADYNSAAACLSLVTKYWGRNGSYYVYWTPTFGTSFTWADGAGMNFTPKDANTLVGADNGYNGEIAGFCFSAFTDSTPSSSSYAGGFEFYDDIQNFVRR